MIGIKERVVILALNLALLGAKGVAKWVILAALELMAAKNREIEKLKGLKNGS